MVQACPVNSETVNNRVVRLVALQVVAVAVLFLAVPHWALPLMLAADFVVRATGQRRFSPLAWAGRTLAALLRLGSQPVNAAPKQFAAGIGVAFSLTAAVLVGLGQIEAARIVMLALVGAASAEAFFGYCFGCAIYGLLPSRIGR